MKKAEAIALFKNVTEMAELLGVSRYTIRRWPDPLERHQANMVKGAKAQQLIDEHKKLEALQK